jgi:hypothetical protein
MLGLKSGAAVQGALVDIELIPMLKTGQNPCTRLSQEHVGMYHSKNAFKGQYTAHVTCHASRGGPRTMQSCMAQGFRLECLASACGVGIV